MYGCEIYANCDTKDKYILNKLYNTIARYIFCLRKFDRISMFSRKIMSMSFDNLLKFRVLVLMHKIIVSRMQPYLFKKLSFTLLARHNHLRRIRTIYLISERQFFIHAICLWNSLPYNLTTTFVFGFARHYLREMAKMFCN